MEIVDRGETTRMDLEHLGLGLCSARTWNKLVNKYKFFKFFVLNLLICKVETVVRVK